jgi:subtilase family serine protease
MKRFIVDAIAGVMVLAMGSIEAAPTQTLLKHVPKAVAESRQLGPVAGTATLHLAIGLPLRNPEELDRLVDQIADPRSSSYRQYLSASEFAERFGPTQQDYDKLIEFVEQNGFRVSEKHANRVILDITGTAGAINKMLHISLTAWDHPTRGRFFAPDRDPSLDFDVQVLNITGLDNFVVPRPMDLKAMSLSSPLPLTSGSGPSGLFLGKDFRAAYAPGVTLTGAGQTIGLVEFDGFYAADVTANFSQAGLPAVAVSTVLLDGFNGAPGSSNIEVILDIAMAGYMAPGAKVIVYEGNYPDDVLNRMATDNSAKQLSCSWGYGIDAATEQIFKQMIAQGQSFFTASGDSGAYSNGIMPPADDPNVTQ